MGENTAAVTWYRDRIHQRQRAANALAIQVGLDALDREDPDALAETVKCLDQAVAILEHARAGLAELSSAARAQAAGGLTDDLSHSMAPLNLAQLRLLRRGRYEGEAAGEDSRSFFAEGR